MRVRGHSNLLPRSIPSVFDEIFRVTIYSPCHIKYLRRTPAPPRKTFFCNSFEFSRKVDPQTTVTSVSADNLTFKTTLCVILSRKVDGDVC